MMSTPLHRSSKFTSADYSDLREFLRGYLHEDWPDEYGSVGEAVEKFWLDTGTASVARVAQQWQALQQISGGKLRKTMELLDQLGGAWNPSSQKDLEEMGEALAKYREGSGRK
jgi:contact-dependent growth inhibition (CDI) system CdiI-like immunity protein